jgi:hypothetical protein
MRKQTMMGSVSEDLDAHGDQEAAAENRGGDHRPIQDNGLNHNSYKMGDPSGNSFPYAAKPKDERWTTGEQADDEQTNIPDLGLDEGKEVGHKGALEQYGISGPDAGGHVEDNTMD